MPDRFHSAACLIGLLFILPSAMTAADPAGDKTHAPDATSAKLRVLAQVKGDYGRWEVLEADGLRILACDDVIQGAVPTTGVALSPTTLVRSRDYVGLIPFFRPDTRNALLLGLGAGIHVRALGSHGIDVHSVDIEPSVVPLAEKYFGFTGELTVADGRAFLDKSHRRFDAIILDTFQGGGVPKQLYTKEAFQRMSDSLDLGGVLAVHLISSPQHPATKAVARTLSAVFPNTVALRGGQGDGIQHIYLLASDEPLNLMSEQRLKLDRFGFTGDEIYEVDTAGAKILTDRSTNLDKLSRDLAEKHRRRSLRLLGR